jgi:hypothetical protein
MSEAAEELCAHCGAPRTAGWASCKFCKTPFVKDTQTAAIPCPRCNTLNELGVQKCVQCQAWVVVQCVFCHALSAHNAPACTHCGEAFAGAPERFAERQRAQHLQQGLQIAGTVGNVAASFLGAAAGAGLFSGSQGYEHQHHHRDYDPPPPPQVADSGGGFFSSLFGGDASSDTSGTGAGLSQSVDSGSSGGGFFDSLLGGDGSSSDGDSSDDDS